MKLHKTSKSCNFVNSYSSRYIISFNFTDEGCYLRVWHANWSAKRNSVPTKSTFFFCFARSQ